MSLKNDIKKMIIKEEKNKSRKYVIIITIIPINYYFFVVKVMSAFIFCITPSMDSSSEQTRTLEYFMLPIITVINKIALKLFFFKNENLIYK